MILIDAHADTLHKMATGSPGMYDLSLDRLHQGGVSLQVMAMFVGESNDPDAIKALFEKMFQAAEQLKAKGWIQAMDPREADADTPRFMLSVEGCEPFEPGLHIIDDYRKQGVRMAAITWNYENALGTPACINQDEGLKPYGIKAARHMQSLGMAVDVSHLNIPGFYDVLHKTDAPPLASHSCCRALCDHPRNLTDQQLKDLFAVGGYVGVNFYPHFLVEGGKDCTIDTLIDHIDHMHQLGGAGKLGFGSDFDGIDKKPEGLDNPADFPKLLEGLRRRGYTQADVEAIAGLNFLAYYGRIS